MRKKRFRPTVECLEQRKLLAADLWYRDSGQSLGTNTDGAAFGDLDDDGDLDLLVGCRDWPGGDACTETVVWLNDGNGQYTRGWSDAMTNVGDLALGDLDQDGDLDAYVSRGSPGQDNPGFGLREQTSEVWLNDGHGNFQDTGWRLENEAWGAIEVALGDVDGDLDLDVVAAYPVGASRVLLNDGHGVFTDSAQRLARSGWTFDVALGDVDDDGDLDAYLARGHENPRDMLYLNDGQGHFMDSGQALDTSFTLGVRLADLDGDHDLDAFLLNGNEIDGVGQPNLVWLNDGTGQFTNSGQILGMSIANSAQLADLDGDGDLDAFVANGTRLFGVVVDQPNEIWFNDGSANFSLGQEMGVSSSYKVALADIDNDGDLDAFLGRIGQGNQVLINTQIAPLKGTFEAIENAVDPTQFPHFTQNGTGSGNATHLGQYTVTYQIEVDALTFVGIGTAHFVAANGDRLFTSTQGLGTDPALDPVATVVETHTITGGTGRFASATGSFHLERSVDTRTGVTTGMLDGTIEIYTHPLRGDIAAMENAVDPTQFPIFTQNGSGSGNATVLGQYTVNYQFEVDARTFAGIGTAHFVAADGDSLFTNGQGLGTDPALDPVATVVEAHTITGGTGQFAGATGNFTLERLVDTRTGVASGVFNGTILIAVVGDANRDAVFDSSDLVQVLQAGEYEDGIAGNSMFEEGDWDGNGEFDSDDLVYAFQRGMYVPAAVPRTVRMVEGSLGETLAAKRRGRSLLEQDSLHAVATDSVFDRPWL